MIDKVFIAEAFESFGAFVSTASSRAAVLYTLTDSA
jgi:hypothetical protein